MLHNCRAVTKQDSASGTHCDLRRRRWWYKRSCWNLVNFQFGDFRVKPYPVILVIYMELASSYEDECSTPSGSTQMATKIPSKAFQRVGNKSIQMTQLRLFTSPNFGFHSSFLAKTQSVLNIKVGLYGYHVGVIWFGSGVTSLVLLWFSDCFSVPISNETSWNLMKFVLAGLLIKWQWGNNDGNMVLYTSFEISPAKTSWCPVCWYVFQLCFGSQPGSYSTDPNWKGKRRQTEFPLPCQLVSTVMLLLEFVASTSSLFSFRMTESDLLKFRILKASIWEILLTSLTALASQSMYAYSCTYYLYDYSYAWYVFFNRLSCIGCTQSFYLLGTSKHQEGLKLPSGTLAQVCQLAEPKLLSTARARMETWAARCVWRVCWRWPHPSRKSKPKTEPFDAGWC